MANTVVHASVVALPLDAGTSMHAARLSTTSRRCARTLSTQVRRWASDGRRHRPTDDHLIKLEGVPLGETSKWDDGDDGGNGDAP